LGGGRAVTIRLVEKFDIRSSEVIGSEKKANGMTLAGHLLNADLLYQAEALDAASRRLVLLAKSVSDENTRISVLCRLTEIACDET
jgi:hypothetical protein